MNFEELCKSLCNKVIRTADDSVQSLVEYSVKSLLQTQSEEFEKIDDLRILEVLKGNDNSARQIRRLFDLVRRIKQYNTDSTLPAKTIAFLYNIAKKDKPNILPINFSNRKKSSTISQSFGKNTNNLNNSELSVPDRSILPTGRQMFPELSIVEKFKQSEDSSISNAINLIFNINPEYSPEKLPQPLADRMSRLKQVGWLFKKVEDVATYKHVDGSDNGDKTPYLVFQAFQYALQQELNEFYSLCSTLSSQALHSHPSSRQNGGNRTRLTLARLEVSLYDMRKTLYWLALIVENCKEKKGGELISSVHEFWSLSGNPSFIKLSERLLKVIVEPLMDFIVSFIKSGVINDPYMEFFVASNPAVEDRDLWTNKYSLRKSMIPSIISTRQAEMILSIGRCLGFLCYIEGPPLSKSPEFLGLISKLSSDSYIMCSHNEEFELKLLKIHDLSNKLVINAFFHVHHFIDHISALKKYLLLSQGDFVRHLMDILEPELCKSASSQQKHTLNLILYTAIRSTNAQYESEMIIQRLSVKLLQMTEDEVGWDIFTLDYDLPHPINTVITRQSMLLYLRAFNFLWRSKRLEYTLSATWLRLMHNSRQLKKLTEMKSIFKVCFTAMSSMTTFVQQLQYYLSFEVLECSWDAFIHKLETAKELNDFIVAHDAFLQDILVRSFIDDSSLNLLGELRSIFDIIVHFQTHLDAVINEAFSELARRESAKCDTFNLIGYKFNIHIFDYKSKFDVYLTTFQDKVRCFLSSLLIRESDDLNFLALRLDFNDYYFQK